MSDILDRSRRRQGVNLDIGPLLDMVFILLIFFIVTSTFQRDTGVEVTKPNAASASDLKKDNIQIAITREGTIHINERQVDLASLKDIVKGMVTQNPEREVVLMADKNSVSGLLVQVVDKCNLAGARKVSVGALAEE